MLVDLWRLSPDSVLAPCSQILPLEIERQQESSDGTQKWLLGLRKGQSVETVYIPMDELPGEEAEPHEGSTPPKLRGAVCVSSQVGCSLTCAFCHTGSMSKKTLRNLGAEEIVGQLLVAKRHLDDWLANAVYPSPPNARAVSNIVFMGTEKRPGFRGFCWTASVFVGLCPL